MCIIIIYLYTCMRMHIHVHVHVAYSLSIVYDVTQICVNLKSGIPLGVLIPAPDITMTLL